MEKQLENIINIAAQLIIDGKATEENAIQLAIIEDCNRCSSAIEAVKAIRDNRENEFCDYQSGYKNIFGNVCDKLNVK